MSLNLKKLFKPTQKKKRVLLTFCLIFVASFVLNLFVHYRYMGNNIVAGVGFLYWHPRMFFFNMFLYFLILLCVVALFRKPFFSISFTFGIAIIVTYIHLNKCALRGTPLLPEDFQLSSEAGSLIKFVNWVSLAKMIVSVILTLILGVFCDKITKKYFQEPKSDASRVWWKKFNILPRCLIFVISLYCLSISTEFIRHHNGQRYEYIELLDTTFTAWNQTRNYDENGFLVGFLYNWSKFDLTTPDGYSEEKIEEIAKKYNTIADNKNKKKKSLDDQDYNIVVILNESFYDPSIIKSVYNYSGDATPNLHNIQKKYPSGNMYSTDFGGGTANIEFEVLTSLTNYWINTVPYTDLIPKVNEVPSLASLAKKNGYNTVAIHPYNGGMYKRNISLQHEGFDTFITENEIQYSDKDENSEYINDRSAYNQVLDVINNNEQKQFIGLITMQNHAPYDESIYEKNTFEVSGNITPENKAEAENYLEILHHSDKYLGEFIKSLEESSEKTVVLFFGDHSPGIFSELLYHPDKELRDNARKTPYFIFSNFDINSPNDLPMTTPNCLGNKLLDTLSVKKPASYYLLDDVCKQTPILTPNYYDGGAPFQSTELSSYELITYDILGGEKYWLQKANQ